MQADHGQITKLLRTARGQLDGILKMVEEDRYCMDIAAQLSATSAILKRANREILAAHLRGCVRDSFLHADETAQNEKIDEIIALMTRLEK